MDEESQRDWYVIVGFGNAKDAADLCAAEITRVLGYITITTDDPSAHEAFVHHFGMDVAQ